jgi:Flp pilus assembly protein TadD
MAALSTQQAFDLALSHHRAGRFGQAEEIYRRIIAHQPDHSDAMHLLGVIAHQTKRNELAVDLIRKALAIQPNFPEAFNNLGSALDELDRLDEAIAAYRQAIKLRPTYAEAHSNLGLGLKDKGQFDEAIAACRRAIALNPSLRDPRLNLAGILMTRGDLEAGLKELEWQWLAQNFGKPLWDGGPLDNQTLLIHADEGLGDTLQLIRYLPMVAQRCESIFVLVQKEIRGVLERTTGPWQYLCPGDPLPPFDFHYPLFGLPLVFKTTLQTIPAEVPYLFPDPELVKSWRERLPLDGQLNVALAWAGSPKFKSDRTRSLSLDRLARLAQVRGVTFYSVQNGYAVKQTEHPPPGMKLVNLEPDFPNTAAIMSVADLVITTDTSMAHLAGGLGRPVWVMLRQIPDFRWLLHGSDSPWYPSMRLFRQPARGDWDSVVEEVATALSRRIDGRA